MHATPHTLFFSFAFYFVQNRTNVYLNANFVFVVTIRYSYFIDVIYSSLDECNICPDICI